VGAVVTRESTDAGTGSGRPSARSDQWQLGLWLWDLLLAGATVLTCVLIAIEDRPVTARIGAVVVVLVLAAGWAVTGRRMALGMFDRITAGRLAYCTALSAGLVLAVALVDSANWAAFVVYSQLFWLLPLAGAIAGVVALTVLLPLAGAVVRGQGLVEDLFPPQAIFMTLFGVLVGIYIHRLADESSRRAELIAELETSQAQVARLSHEAGVAVERERLAGEIHDTLAQGFTSIVTLLQAAQAQFDADPPAARRHVDLAVRTARENLREARNLVAASAPADLAPHSLADAVGRQAGRLAEETGVAATHATTGSPRRLPAEIEIVRLRAAQELLANVGRHAGARTVRVELDYTGVDVVALTVTDDGVGFDPDVVGEASFGLRMMRGRAERLGGVVTVRSGPGGTTVAVRLPTGVEP
jgi:signal transduction histidine kinase